MNILQDQVFQSVSPATIAILLISSLFLYLLCTRKQNHRLPPSPPSLPIIGHLHHLGPLIHQSFHNLSTRYGPLIYLRLGSVPCVVVSTPELASDFLKTNDLAFGSRPQSSAIKHITYGVAFAFARSGPYWSFIKKMATVELLGNQNLDHFLPIRSLEIQELLQTLMEKAKRQESVNLTQELFKLTNNVICQMVMGMRCSGTKGEADEVKNLVGEIVKIFGEFNVSDFIWFCKNIDFQGFKKRYEGTHKRYDALLEKIISEREIKRRRETLKQESLGRDCLDILLDIMEDEKAEIKITRDHIKSLILDFFIAGTDTTATAIEWILAELIKNPNVLKEAQREIDQVIGHNRLVEESDLPKLPYMHAIIKESLRLHPPIPMVNRQSTENVTIQGYDIPAGTILFVNTWSIGRNPVYWENPLEFNPHRFLEGSTIDVIGQNYQLLPFGTGRRACPGIKFSMRELQVVVARLVQCFEWKVVTDKQALNMDEQPGLAVPRAEDLVCFPTVRGNIQKMITSY
ncbi:flavone synthase II [Artemisia annua]|uniref:Flavone synthase II n=1 Tax=Artemisia annua TaxID=35608 RepID=A0A2U1MJ75_ARTAN|nr:flavone synthase II [Artemisia annua]